VVFDDSESAASKMCSKEFYILRGSYALLTPLRKNSHFIYIFIPDLLCKNYIENSMFSSDVLTLRLSYNILISFNKVEMLVPILAEIGIIGKSICSLSNCKLT